MDERLKKRIFAFYLGGILNALIGLYVVIEGPAFLPADTVRTLALVFLAFTAVNFYFPYAMKKKWLEDQARGRAGDNPPEKI